MKMCCASFRSTKAKNKAAAKKAKELKALGTDSDSVPSPQPPGEGLKGAKTKSAALEAEERGKRDGKEVKKKKTDSVSESEISFLQRPEIKIEMPSAMKEWLVDDWDFISRQKK